jgi:hypothetical protein
MARPGNVVRLKTRGAYSPPEALWGLPDDDQGIIRIAHELIDICRSNVGQRSATYRAYHDFVEAGRFDNTKSMCNLMFALLDRRAAMLYSPTDIRFSLDFENDYDKITKERGRVVTRLLGRSWERTNTDTQFAQGVFESLKYGASILKQWPVVSGSDRLPEYRSGLIMPWQFGVYRPDMDDLDEQPAMVETSTITLPEVWRRIWQRPDARALFERIKSNAAGNQGNMEQSWNHPVLSSSPLQFESATRPMPGGVVALTSTGAFDGARPDPAAPTVVFHEIWVWHGADYSTIQLIEPDILIAPWAKMGNMLIQAQDSGLHPYTLIQANQQAGNIWGRSELADVMSTQDFLSQTMTDLRQLFGLQVDKILAITGDGLTDEQYGQMKTAGYMNLGPGGAVNDLTPKIPPETLPLIERLIGIIDLIAGFDNMLSGKGESGVRSGVQANPLMKVASARLKDDSLLIERQCAKAADLRLSLMEAKDGRKFWLDAEKIEETGFLLTDIPDDRRVVVDGHTTSPIFADEHQSLLVGGLKMGLVDKQSAIEMLPFQNKETLIARMKEAAVAQAALMAELKRLDPEGYAHAAEKAITGGAKKK